MLRHNIIWSYTNPFVGSMTGPGTAVVARRRRYSVTTGLRGRGGSQVSGMRGYRGRSSRDVWGRINNVINTRASGRSAESCGCCARRVLRSARADPAIRTLRVIRVSVIRWMWTKSYEKKKKLLAEIHAGTVSPTRLKLPCNYYHCVSERATEYTPHGLRGMNYYYHGYP